MRAMFVGVVLLVASGAAVSHRAPSPEPTTRRPAGVPTSLLARADTQSDLVSFFELLGSPAAFQGKRVRVIGFAHVEFEGKGPMGTHLRSSYRVESAGEGSSLTFESEFGGAALAAMAGPLEKASDDALAKSIAQFTKLV